MLSAENEGLRLKKTFYARFLKRFLDIVISLCALTVLCLPMALLALLVRLKLGAPVLFTQDRPGKDEKIFRLYKFRTMTNERGADGELLPDDVQIGASSEDIRLAGSYAVTESAIIDGRSRGFYVLAAVKEV